MGAVLKDIVISICLVGLNLVSCPFYFYQIMRDALNKIMLLTEVLDITLL